MEVSLMKEIWNWLQLAIAAIGGFLGWFLGGYDGFLYALIAFIVIDYVTGVLCAIIDKKLCSEIGAKGIFKKVLIFAMVGIAHIIDTQILGSIGEDSGALRTAVIFFYLSNEGISILENAGHIGLPIPEKLKSVLQQLHKRDEEPRKPGDGV
jgi:toxin secretion/phage lysis holin